MSMSDLQRTKDKIAKALAEPPFDLIDSPIVNHLRNNIPGCISHTVNFYDTDGAFLCRAGVETGHSPYDLRPFAIMAAIDHYKNEMDTDLHWHKVQISRLEMTRAEFEKQCTQGSIAEIYTHPALWPVPDCNIRLSAIINVINSGRDPRSFTEMDEYFMPVHVGCLKWEATCRLQNAQGLAIKKESAMKRGLRGLTPKFFR